MKNFEILFYASICSLLLAFSCNQKNLSEGLKTEDKPKVLFICSNVAEVNGHKNGTFLSEIAVPFVMLNEKGFDIDIVSPQGGPIPIYYKFDTTELIQKALDSEIYHQKISNTLLPYQVKSENYKAIVIPGGYGQFWDIHENPEINTIISEIYENDGIIGSLGHGTSSLVNVRLSNGEYLVKNKTLTCFPSWFEKEIMFEADYGRLLTFDMEEELENRGANLLKVDKETRSNGEIVDTKNRLITASSATGGEFIANEIIKIIESNKK